MPRHRDAAALCPPPQLAGAPTDRPVAGGYELTFRYTGPGTNHCTYTPSAARWRCSGAW